MRTTWGSAVALSMLGLASQACGGSAAEAPGEPAASESAPIVGGTPSDTSDDAVVLIYDAVAGFACTGVIIAPTLVLTARHCVSDVVGDALQCDVSGHAVRGGQLGADLPAADLSVFVGTTRTRDFPAPTARGIAIFHDDAANLCDHDVAVIQVDAVMVAPVARLRLGATAVAGEAFTVIGWGATSQADVSSVRERRTGVGVLAVGPSTYLGVAVPPNDFLLGESLCSGDSGGPAISAFSGAVVGVASFGGNGTSEVPGNAASTCVDRGSGVVNTFTALAPFRNVIDAAFAAAGATPQIDDGTPPVPTPRTGGCTVPCAGAERTNGNAPGAVAMIAALGAVLVGRRRRF